MINVVVTVQALESEVHSGMLGGPAPDKQRHPQPGHRSVGGTGRNCQGGAAGFHPHADTTARTPVREPFLYWLLCTRAGHRVSTGRRSTVPRVQPRKGSGFVTT